MGYTTEFTGSFKFNKPLEARIREYLVKFNETRRMARTLSPAYGVEGEFFVDAHGDYGQDRSSDIIDYNRPPSTQPGLWCQWRPNEDGTELEWDGGEKFYHYVEWLEYLIAHFIEKNGYKLSGTVQWQGEDSDDRGEIVVTDNKVSTFKLVLTRAAQ